MNILKDKIKSCKTLDELEDMLVWIVFYTEKQYFKENQKLFKLKKKKLKGKEKYNKKMLRRKSN